MDRFSQSALLYHIYSVFSTMGKDFFKSLPLSLAIGEKICYNVGKVFSDFFGNEFFSECELIWI